MPPFPIEFNTWSQKSYSRERKREEERREGERRTGEKSAAVWAPGRGREKGESG